jgi:acetyltransferase-like isoleucine patch superfamily enzyme
MTTSNAAPHPAPEAEEFYRRWIQFLDDELTRHSSAERRAEIVRDQLYQLYLGRPHSGPQSSVLTTELPATILELSLAPNNVTLEAESFPEIDRTRYAERKPLLWFWKMFDRSPVGMNLWLGWRFRAMLARHIFAALGQGVKLSPGIELTFGYNLSIGDGASIRPGALLNDRGGITIGAKAVVGSYARVFSHAHDTVDYDKVSLRPTTIGDGAHIASHEIVLGGSVIANGALLGSFPDDPHL